MARHNARGSLLGGYHATSGAPLMRKLLALTLVSAAALAGSSPASAAEVLFEFTGPNAISFTVDQSPTPDLVQPSSFLLQGVAVTVNGVTSLAQITFDISGGLGSGLFLFVGSGASTFSGGPSNPTFLTGTRSIFGGPFPDAANYRLTISEVQSASVPEPATWAMLLLGIGAVGFALRRRKQMEVTLRRTA